ncbi:hypothetical protein G7Y89_g2420 [Cudoniella acicularis]|uniref:Cytochrome P450 n=1 Tax=Cudoniella acicularis TaxID=354080 RepID=A0A8H4RTH1_9HELO|nr:hypothetical protein G7Y89_g2420 [Cudoniella acicularis]
MVIVSTPKTKKPMWSQPGPKALKSSFPPPWSPGWTRNPKISSNAKECTFENMMFKHTVEHPEITHNDMLDKIISKDLTKTIGSLNKELMEEIALSFESIWGTDTENWKEVVVWDTMIKTIARTANRIFVGPELCKNDDYLESCVKWTRAIQISGAILHTIPNFLKSSLAWFVTIPNRRERNRSMKYTLPLVTQRMTDMERKRLDPSWEWEEPNDTITWLIHDSQTRTLPHEKSAEGLAYRLLLLNFAAVSTSAIGVTSAIFDIFSSPVSSHVPEGIYEECSRVLSSEPNGVWTKTGWGGGHRIGEEG